MARPSTNVKVKGLYRALISLLGVQVAAFQVVLGQRGL